MDSIPELISVKFRPQTGTEGSAFREVTLHERNRMRGIGKFLKSFSAGSSGESCRPFQIEIGTIELDLGVGHLLGLDIQSGNTLLPWTGG